MTVNERAEQTLETIGLQDKREVLAGALGHAEQRQIDLGIALAQDPRLLLLDEPTGGMSPFETEQCMRFIKQLAQRVTIVLVEHKMQVVMSISDRITVLNFGQVIAEGAPDDIRDNRRVQDLYLEGSGICEDPAARPTPAAAAACRQQASLDTSLRSVSGPVAQASRLRSAGF